MTVNPRIELFLFATIGALMGCGAGSRPGEPSPSSARPSTSGDDTPLSSLAESSDPYARAHADLVGSTLADTRRAAANAENAACRADAEAHLDALASHLVEHPSVALDGIRAATEARIRLAACEADSCAIEATGLDAESRAALLLDLPAAASAAGRAHPLVVGALAEAEQDWNAALESTRVLVTSWRRASG